MALTGAHFLSPALFMMTLCVSCATLAAQMPAPPPAAPSKTVAPPQTVKTASAIMQPSLDSLRQVLDVLQPEKWKAPSGVREEAANNIDSIRRDLANTLPPLLANADGAPDSVAHVLPAYRNIEALYDVLLRITEAGRHSAPSQQAITLEQTLTSLESGRRALGEQLQSVAVARDQQVLNLQTAVRAAAQHPSVPAPASCPPPPRTKRRTRSKTTHKPAATTHKPAAPTTSQQTSH